MPTEYILAYHCAPAFAGIKPSNIARAVSVKIHEYNRSDKNA